jgi:CDP-glucose 4,6-dehydratase
MESLEMNSKFWKGKKVLITGHTGFKGSWLSLWLQKLDASVTGYALAPPTNPCLFELAQVEKEMVSLLADVRDFNALLAALKKYEPEIIIHMAAQPLVRQSYKDPLETYQTNVIGTANMLEAVRQTKSVRAVVNVTTDKCYENKESLRGYSEDDPLGGHDPYSSSKACSEHITSAFRSSFFPPANITAHGVGIATARAGNVIGGGDWAQDRLIPDCIKAWLKGKVVKIRSPKAIRPWQHVLESLSGYLLLAEKLYQSDASCAEAWNFGPDENDTASVEEAIKELAGFWTAKASWKMDGDNHPHETGYLKLDSSKARTKLGWKPKWNLTTTLMKTAQWYQQYQTQPDKIKEKTLMQINEYTKE